MEKNIHTIRRDIATVDGVVVWGYCGTRTGCSAFHKNILFVTPNLYHIFFGRGKNYGYSIFSLVSHFNFASFGFECVEVDKSNIS